MRLEPATYGESSGAESFRRRFPWRLLLAVVAVLSLVVALHRFTTNRRIEALRSEVLELIDREVRPVRGELDSLKARLSELALARYRAGGVGEPHVSEGFGLDELREGPVLTLRLIRRGALGEDEIHLAVKHGAPDDIGSCLGVPNLPAAELYEGGDFLGDEFVRRVRDASSELELRGLLDQLQRRIDEVLPKLREAASSGRMILSIERPDEALIEVYIVELAPGRDRLRLLAEAEGRLLSATVALGEGRDARAREVPPVGLRGAVDCAVASQMRLLLDPVEPGAGGG